MASAALQNPGNGFDPFTKTQKIGSTNAVTRGDVGQVRESLIDATSGLFRTVIAPEDTVSSIEAAIFVVALEDIAAGEVGWWGVVGVFDVLVDDAADVNLGDSLSAAVGADKLSISSVNEKVIAKPTETLTATNGDMLLRCYFDGWSGFGQQNA